MANAPSMEEVRAEVARLIEMKPRVPHFSGFNDDNWKRMDVQIEVLSVVMTEKQIERRWGEGDTEDAMDLYSHAREAYEWMTGSDDAKPSDSWKPLVGAKVKPVDPRSMGL